MTKHLSVGRAVLTWDFFFKAELGVQQSCEEKASGIFTPCGMCS